MVDLFRSLVLRPFALALPLIIVALAGCTVALPDPAHPEEPGVVWTDTDANLWVVRHGHCGFGTGRENACESITALYRDGAVLHFTYGRGGFEGDPVEVQFMDAEDRTAHDDEVQAIWQATFGAAPEYALVHEVDARRLDPSEREDVGRVVEQALREFKPLSEPTFDCEDCGSITFWAFGPPRSLEEQESGSPTPKDDAWRLLEEQMAILREWVAS